jgi:DNA sulfur modification protein DndD
MQITELTVENFRPYYGDVTINPQTEAGHPLVLVLGKNDTGKTSLFTAIRFCLYGADSRDERTTHINRRAAEESDGVSRVEMTFLHDDDIYTIERTIEYSQVDDADDRYASNWNREVRTPNDVIVSSDASEREYRKFINRILPENVARFFLFDAEELQRFEESHDETVRESIETILGIQEVENAIGDLRDRKNKFDREYANFESTANEVESLREELREVLDRLDEIGDDKSGEIAELNEKSKTKQSNLNAVRNKLEEIQDAEPLRSKKQDLQTELQEERNELADVKKERNQLRRDIGPIIAARGRDLFEDRYEVEGASGEAEVLHQVLGREFCVCGEKITDDRHQEIMERYSQLQSPQHQRLADLMATCRDSDINVQSKLNLYQQYQASIRRLERSIQNNEAELADLQDRIDEIEESEKAGLKQKEKTLQEEINELDKEVQGLREDRGELKAKRDRLQTRISGMEEAGSEAERLRDLSALAERCKSAFTDIKDELVESRRDSVESHATDTFLRLTNRPDYYQGLEITDNYELRVVTSGGATRSLEEQDPSAGQTQIIAYSFIAGLSKYTTRSAPVVIDTPIGRLDPEHKANLLDFYHEFSDQVMILYQPNELTREDIDEMSEYISKHYEIQIRDDDSSSSTIVDRPDLLAIPEEA